MHLLRDGIILLHHCAQRLHESVAGIVNIDLHIGAVERLDSVRV